MRVVQLDMDSQRVEFHPYLTVVRGLDNELRERLVAALAALAQGEAAAEGMVEAHGVFLDLSDEALALLDLPPSNGAGPGLDLVVRADQLPRALGPTALARGELDRRREQIAQQVAQAEAEAERARLALATSRWALGQDDPGGSSAEGPGAELERLRQQREALEAQLESAKSEHARAQQAQSAAEERLARARQKRMHAAQSAEEETQALDEARAGRDPFAAAAFDAARERLRRLQRADAGVDETEPPVEVGEPSDEGRDAAAGAAPDISALESRQTELEAALLAIDTVDPFAVETALSQLESNDDVELVPSPEAEQVADDWVRNEAALSGEASNEELSGNVLAAARRRLDEARAAVFEAERAVRAPEIDRLDIEALENAHEAVLHAQDRADKRFGGDRARQKLADARAEEQTILDRIGFPTYSSFMMGTSIQHVDAEREQRLEAVRVELAAAEDALGDLEQGMDAELARAELHARRRALRDDAVRILGRDPGDDIEWALRHHRVEVRGSQQAAQRLRSALEAAGVMLGGEEPPERMLLDLARIWLDEQLESASHREQFARDLGEVEAALDRARKPSWQARSDDDADEQSRRRLEIDEARVALEEAKDRLELQSYVEADISKRKEALAAAAAAERAALVELVAAEGAEADAAQVEHESSAEQARLEAELATTSASEREIAAALNELSQVLENGPSGGDRAAREAAARDAEAARNAAESAVDAAREELAQVDRLLENLTTDDEAGDPAVASTEAVEELAWYL